MTTNMNDQHVTGSEWLGPFTALRIEVFSRKRTKDYPPLAVPDTLQLAGMLVLDMVNQSLQLGLMHGTKMLD